MAHSITIATLTPVSLDMLKEFMYSLGAVDEGNDDIDEIYLQLRVDGEQVATISVPLDRDVSSLHSEEDLDCLRHALGGPAASEIQITAYGYETFHISTAMAFQVAERMIAAWGGCVSFVIGYGPPKHWVRQLPHV